SHDMITLSNSFIWDGVSNVLVDICTGNSSMSFGSPYGGVRAESMPNGSRHIRVDGGSTLCGSNTNTTNSNRPQIRFNYIPGTPLACPQLFEIALENPSQTSVDVTFTDATGDVYIEYGETPFTPGED